MEKLFFTEESIEDFFIEGKKSSAVWKIIRKQAELFKDKGFEAFAIFLILSPGEKELSGDFVPDSWRLATMRSPVKKRTVAVVDVSAKGNIRALDKMNKFTAGVNSLEHPIIIFSDAGIDLWSKRVSEWKRYFSAKDVFRFHTDTHVVKFVRKHGDDIAGVMIVYDNSLFLFSKKEQ